MAAILLIVRASFVDISREIKAARWAQEYTRHAAEKPSTQNLPKIALQQPEAVVIMAPIAGLRPATPYPSGIHYADGGPDPVGFRVIYALEKQSSSKHDLEPSAAVSIGEYPNAEWAKYRSGDMLMGGSQINKFGSQILAQTRFAPNTGYSYFQWPSDGWVVTLTVYRVEPEEFLKAYLAKYPSSLQ
jgi:hypothetical protein